MRIRILTAAALASVAALMAAPAANAGPIGVGGCDGYHDVEVHVTGEQCLLVNWPVAQ